MRARIRKYEKMNLGIGQFSSCLSLNPKVVSAATK
jgi:hypothetical protein